MAPEKHLVVNQTYVSNILATAQQATTIERATGMIWYPTFDKAICTVGEQAGLSASEARALFACMSPQAHIKRNWDNFVSCCRDGGPENTVGLTRVMYHKACAVFSGAMDLEKVIGGPKVTRFYQNFAGDHNVVTVDKHAVDCANGSREERGNLSLAKYLEYQTAYQAVATVLEIEPCQCQAMTWATWRRLNGIADDGGISLVA